MGTIKTSELLPKKLRGQPLNQKVAEITDWLVEEFYDKDLNKVKALWDASKDGYDSDEILTIFGGETFGDILFQAAKKDTLARIIARLYNLKGTKKGMQFLFSLLDLHPVIHEWWRVNREIAKGSEEGQYWLTQDEVGISGMEPCTVLVDLGVGDHLLVESIDDKLVVLIETLLWTCVRLSGIRWTKVLEDHIHTDIEYAIDILFPLWDKYSLLNGSASCNTALVYGRHYDRHQEVLSNLYGKFTFLPERDPSCIRFQADTYYDEPDYNAIDVGPDGNNFGTGGFYVGGDTHHHVLNFGGFNYGAEHSYGETWTTETPTEWVPVSEGIKYFGVCPITGENIGQVRMDEIDTLPDSRYDIVNELVYSPERTFGAQYVYWALPRRGTEVYHPPGVEIATTTHEIVEEPKLPEEDTAVALDTSASDDFISQQQKSIDWKGGGEYLPEPQPYRYGGGNAVLGGFDFGGWFRDYDERETHHLAHGAYLDVMGDPDQTLTFQGGFTSRVGATYGFFHYSSLKFGAFLYGDDHKYGEADHNFQPDLGYYFEKLHVTTSVTEFSELVDIPDNADVELGVETVYEQSSALGFVYGRDTFGPNAPRFYLSSHLNSDVDMETEPFEDPYSITAGYGHDRNRFSEPETLHEIQDHSTDLRVDETEEATEVAQTDDLKTQTGRFYGQIPSSDKDVTVLFGSMLIFGEFPYGEKIPRATDGHYFDVVGGVVRYGTRLTYNNFTYGEIDRQRILDRRGEETRPTGISNLAADADIHNTEHLDIVGDGPLYGSFAYHSTTFSTDTEYGNFTYGGGDTKFGRGSHTTIRSLPVRAETCLGVENQNPPTTDELVLEAEAVLDLTGSIEDISALKWENLFDFIESDRTTPIAYGDSYFGQFIYGDTQVTTATGVYWNEQGRLINDGTETLQGVSAIQAGEYDLNLSSRVLHNATVPRFGQFEYRIYCYGEIIYGNFIYGNGPTKFASCNDIILTEETQVSLGELEFSESLDTPTEEAEVQQTTSLESSWYGLFESTIKGELITSGVPGPEITFNQVVFGEFTYGDANVAILGGYYQENVIEYLSFGEFPFGPEVSYGQFSQHLSAIKRIGAETEILTFVRFGRFSYSEDHLFGLIPGTSLQVEYLGRSEITHEGESFEVNDHYPYPIYDELFIYEGDRFGAFAYGDGTVFGIEALPTRTEETHTIVDQGPEVSDETSVTMEGAQFTDAKTAPTDLTIEPDVELTLLSSAIPVTDAISIDEETPVTLAFGEFSYGTANSFGDIVYLGGVETSLAFGEFSYSIGHFYGEVVRVGATPVEAFSNEIPPPETAIYDLVLMDFISTSTEPTSNLVDPETTLTLAEDYGSRHPLDALEITGDATPTEITFGGFHYGVGFSFGGVSAGVLVETWEDTSVPPTLDTDHESTTYLSDQVDPLEEESTSSTEIGFTDTYQFEWKDELWYYAHDRNVFLPENKFGYFCYGEGTPVFYGHFNYGQAHYSCTELDIPLMEAPVQAEVLTTNWDLSTQRYDISSLDLAPGLPVSFNEMFFGSFEYGSLYGETSEGVTKTRTLQTTAFNEFQYGGTEFGSVDQGWSPLFRRDGQPISNLGLSHTTIGEQGVDLFSEMVINPELLRYGQFAYGIVKFSVTETFGNFIYGHSDSKFGRPENQLPGVWAYDNQIEIQVETLVEDFPETTDENNIEESLLLEERLGVAWVYGDGQRFGEPHLKFRHTGPESIVEELGFEDVYRGAADVLAISKDQEYGGNVFFGVDREYGLVYGLRVVLPTRFTEREEKQFIEGEYELEDTVQMPVSETGTSQTQGLVSDYTGPTPVFGAFSFSSLVEFGHSDGSTLNEIGQELQFADTYQFPITSDLRWYEAGSGFNPDTNFGRFCYGIDTTPTLYGGFNYGNIPFGCQSPNVVFHPPLESTVTPPTAGCELDETVPLTGVMWTRFGQQELYGAFEFGGWVDTVQSQSELDSWENYRNDDAIPRFGLVRFGEFRYDEVHMDRVSQLDSISLEESVDVNMAFGVAAMENLLDKYPTPALEPGDIPDPYLTDIYPEFGKFLYGSEVYGPEEIPTATDGSHFKTYDRPITFGEFDFGGANYGEYVHVENELTLPPGVETGISHLPTQDTEFGIEEDWEANPDARYGSFTYGGLHFEDQLFGAFVYGEADHHFSSDKNFISDAMGITIEEFDDDGNLIDVIVM